MAGIVDPSERIPALDGLRAIAIALVMLSHGFILSDVSTKEHRAINYVAGQLGGLGVALFFAISGYLITTLLLREIEANGRISLKGFYLRRAFRILPPAYLYLAVMVMAGVALHPGELTSAAFFFSNYWQERSWFTQHFWSLSMEEHFYLWWPAALAFLGVRRATIAACLTIGATMLWRPWSLSHINWPFPALQRTDMRLDAFLFAGLLAILLRSDYAPQLMAVLGSSRMRVALVSSLVTVTGITLMGSIPATGTLLQSLILPLLLGSMVFAAGRPGFRVLESAPLRWMGKISYGLYLWQQLFLVGHTATSFGIALQWFLPRVLATFGVAVLSYYAMERFALNYGRMLSRRAGRWGGEPPGAYVRAARAAR